MVIAKLCKAASLAFPLQLWGFQGIVGFTMGEWPVLKCYTVLSNLTSFIGMKNASRVLLTGRNRALSDCEPVRAVLPLYSSHFYGVHFGSFVYLSEMLEIDRWLSESSKMGHFPDFSPSYF